jgi:hypothetical protein
MSWFQAFAVFCMSCVNFWVVQRRVVFDSRRFATLCLFQLHRHSFRIHLPMKMEQTQCFETPAIKHHTPEKISKGYTRHIYVYVCITHHLYTHQLCSLSVNTSIKILNLTASQNIKHINIHCYALHNSNCCHFIVIYYNALFIFSQCSITLLWQKSFFLCTKMSVMAAKLSHKM